jgi:hypothetical protein
MFAASGDRATARQEAMTALRMAREIRNPTCLALALFTFGWAVWDEQPEVALASLQESIALSRAGAVDGGLGTALAVVARIHMNAGRLPDAWRTLRDAVVYSQDVGDTSNLGFALFEMLDGLGRMGGHDAFVAELGGALKEGLFRALLLQTGGDELMRRETALTRVRESTDPDAYEVAFARGASLTYDEVIDLALAKLDALLAEASDGRG